MYIYCVVCYRVVLASYVSVGYVLHTFTLLMTIRNTLWTMRLLSIFPSKALHNCHYWHWLIKHDANLIHIPGTNFTAGWRDDPFLQGPNAGLELATPRLPISCPTN